MILAVGFAGALAKDPILVGARMRRGEGAAILPEFLAGRADEDVALSAMDEVARSTVQFVQAGLSTTGTCVGKPRA
jgi:hypothetical protein